MLTEKETLVLNAITTDDFMDGLTGYDMVGKQIWADTGCDHIASATKLPRTSLGGVIASLSTKGLLNIYEDGKDSTYALTTDGVHILVGGELPIL